VLTGAATTHSISQDPPIFLASGLGDLPVGQWTVIPSVGLDPIGRYASVRVAPCKICFGLRGVDEHLLQYRTCNTQPEMQEKDGKRGDTFGKFLDGA